MKKQYTLTFYYNDLKAGNIKLLKAEFSSEKEPQERYEELKRDELCLGAKYTAGRKTFSYEPKLTPDGMRAIIPERPQA